MKALKTIRFVLFFGMIASLSACGGGGSSSSGGGNPATNAVTISLGGTGAGVVTSSPAGINCPGSCTAAFATGTMVTLTVTPAPGSYFAGWGGVCSGVTGNTCSGSVTKDAAVTAIFNTNPVAGNFNLTVIPGGTGSGTVTSNPAGINCGATCTAPFSSGTSVTLTATPATGSTFAGWSGGVCTGTGTCVVNLTANTTVIASFDTINVTGTITGTISYSGAKMGRIYISVSNGTSCLNCNGQFGTSINSTGGFTIRGVTPGTYTVTAYRDTLGYGTISGSSPSVSVSGVAVTSNANTNVGTMTLTDPAPVTPATPTGFTVFPGDKSAIFIWNSIKTNNVDQVDAYKIYCDGAASACLTIPALGNGHAFTSLSNAAHTFTISSVAGGFESAKSTAVPATIGALPGGFTVSGTVTLPAVPVANLTLYVALCGGCTGGGGAPTIYVQAIPNPPTTTQSYTISGVPSGTYQLFAVMDNNNNGIEDIGDWYITGNGNILNPPTVTVAGSNVTNQNVTLPGTNSLSLVKTQNHQLAGGSPVIYGVGFEVDPMVKLPVNVTVTSGANLPVPIDLANNPTSWGVYSPYFFNMNPNTTAPSGSYVLTITYSDGTTETVAYPVTLLNSYATPTGPADGSGTTPIFTWTAPSSPPVALPYTYILNVFNFTNFSGMWYYQPNKYGMPSTQTSVVYNTGGGAVPLTSGVKVYWEIWVQDANGNQAINQTTYTP